MKRLLTILLFCILTVGMASVACAEEDKWQYASANNIIVMFFDTKSFQKTGDNTYSTYIKHSYMETYGKSLADELKLKQPVSYSLYKNEYNYSTKQSRCLSVVHYANDDTQLGAQSYNNAKWQKHVPDSVDEAIFDATYEYYKKHYQ